MILDPSQYLEVASGATCEQFIIFDTTHLIFNIYDESLASQHRMNEAIFSFQKSPRPVTLRGRTFVPRHHLFLARRIKSQAPFLGLTPVGEDLWLYAVDYSTIDDLLFNKVPDSQVRLSSPVCSVLRSIIALTKKIWPAVEVTTYTWPEYAHVREKVFVEEQHIAKSDEFDEWDAFDSGAIHLCIRQTDTSSSTSTSVAEETPTTSTSVSSKAVSVCRLHLCGPYMKLERVATLQEFRGRSLGQAISFSAIHYVNWRAPLSTVVAHAQTEKLDFYSRIGFLTVSQEFLDEVDILHRTIFFPSLDNKPIGIASVTNKSSFAGDCYDPVVVQKIASIQESDFIPLSSLVLFVSDGVGKLKRQFMDVALSIQNYSISCRYSSLFDVGFTPKSIPLEEARKTLKELIHNAWCALNVGFYGEVPEYWRSFYAIVQLCNAVLHDLDGDVKGAIHCIDKGIMMGRQETLSARNRVLSSYAQRLHDTLPVTQHLSIASNVFPAPAKLEHAVTPWWDVLVLEGLDKEAVLSRLSQELPCVMRGAAKHWPALSKWSFEWLLQVAGERTVPIEIGSRYDGEDWTQKLITVREFVEKYMTDTAGKPGYLAQHRLLDQVPAMLADVDTQFVSDYGTSVEWNAWFGPSGTISSIHQDPRENFFFQIVGQKFVRLVHSCEKENVYPREDILKNTSQVDAENPDYTKFPLFGKVHVVDVELGPGDVLYIPRSFWHYVKSLTPSMSVSAWFDQRV